MVDAALLKSMADLLWPIIFLFVLFLFRPAFLALVESARSRKFTLKIAGQELTMEEVSEQQRSLLTDLQSQVVELRKKLEGGGLQPAAGSVPARLTGRGKRAILWVDDNPKNNSYFIQQLEDFGIRVDLALSTSDGLRRFDRDRYDTVISDMGRSEDGSYNPKAGVAVTKAVHEKSPDVPIVIFCSSRRAKEYGPEAIAAGATAVTSSPTELFGVLRLEEKATDAG